MGVCVDGGKSVASNEELSNSSKNFRTRVVVQAHEMLKSLFHD